ncbi:MAG: sensor histidine kinase [Leptolyngbya sp. IPPAS B-1204]|nr:MAG: sensor histidine kinase [Leptolyngbya sp. IPPAS B-1204]
MAAQTTAWGAIGKLRQYGKLAWQRTWQKLTAWQQQPAESADYQAWRHRFLSDRLRLCLWIAVPCFITIVLHNIYELYLYPQEFEQNIIQYFGNPDLPDRVRRLSMITNFVIGVLLTACLVLQRTRWGQRYPALLFLGFSWSITLAPQVIGTHFRIPDSGGGGVWFLVFLVQATLMPVHWGLHLISQLGAIAYYVGINPLLGLTTIEGKSIYNAGLFILLFWFCFICDLAVYLYERLQRAEFESRRELRVFLHAVSHDLKTPVMGTSIVLQNLLRKATDDQVVVHRQVLERLLQGSNRQLALINSLLEAHAAEVQDLALHRQPIQLSHLVESVLADLEPTLTKNQIILYQQISPDLPSVDADATQLWRVYSNLITNAIRHNPHGIKVTLTAEVLDPAIVKRLQNRRMSRLFKRKGSVTSEGLPQSDTNGDSLTCWIRCAVQDNGIGIPPVQQERLFELYARGSRARYMPGLGLGLYLCRQIITAHGGEIGVSSTPGGGATFWFTLPVAKD